MELNGIATALLTWTMARASALYQQGVTLMHRMPAPIQDLFCPIFLRYASATSLHSPTARAGFPTKAQPCVLRISTMQGQPFLISLLEKLMYFDDAWPASSQKPPAKIIGIFQDQLQCVGNWNIGLYCKTQFAFCIWYEHKVSIDKNVLRLIVEV